MHIMHFHMHIMHFDQISLIPSLQFIRYILTASCFVFFFKSLMSRLCVACRCMDLVPSLERRTPPGDHIYEKNSAFPNDHHLPIASKGCGFVSHSPAWNFG